MLTLAYASSLSGGFIYEDGVELRVTDPGAAAVVAQALRYPIRSLPRVTRLFGRESPPVARAINLAWHLVNGLLLGVIARRLVSSAALIFAIGLFWLHPVQTETVAYIASRPELIAATCVLLALLAMQRGWILTAWLCAAAAVTAKEFAVTALLLVPLTAWWTGQRWTRTQIAAWTVSVALVGLAALPLLRMHYLLPIALPVIAAQLTELWRLLALLPEALVHPQALTIDHDWRWITRPVALAGVALWCVALVASARAKWPPLGFALLWTLVALAPRLLLPVPDGLHEHHLYTPMIAISFAIGAALFPTTRTA